MTAHKVTLTIEGPDQSPPSARMLRAAMNTNQGVAIAADMRYCHVVCICGWERRMGACVVEQFIREHEGFA